MTAGTLRRLVAALRAYRTSPTQAAAAEFAVAQKEWRDAR